MNSKPIGRVRNGAKPVPRRLNDALDAVPKYRPAEPRALQAKGAAKPRPRGRGSKSDGVADPLADERAMFNAALGGAGNDAEARLGLRVPRAAARGHRGGDASPDLLSSMAARLAKVEESKGKLKAALVAERERRRLAEAQKTDLEALLQQTQAAGAESTEVYLAAVEETRLLKKQIADMEAFLAEYGLVWVGTGPPRPPRRGGSGSAPRESKATADAKAMSAPPRGVDVDAFLVGLRRLNAQLKDKPQFALNAADAPEVPITVFADGIFLYRGPLRPWGDSATQAFLKDVADGFWPAEFREKYPDGVRIKATDRRAERSADALREAKDAAAAAAGSGDRIRTVHSGSGAAGDSDMAPLSKEDFLNRIPQRQVMSNGDVVDMRDDIATILGRFNGGFNGAGEGHRLGGAPRSASKLADSEEQEDDEAAAAAVEEEVFLADTPALRTLHKSLRRGQLGGTEEEEAAGAGADADPGAAALTGEMTSIRVRLPPTVKAGVVLVKLLRTESVAALYDAVAAFLGSAARSAQAKEARAFGFELRTAFPPRVHTDLGVSLENAGLCPSAVVIARET